MIKEIKLPEIADNVNSAVVTDILVSVGDTVTAVSPLAEMESDKASFELPADIEGVVKEIKIKKGETVKVGQVLFVIDTDLSAIKSKEEPKINKAEVPQQENIVIPTTIPKGLQQAETLVNNDKPSLISDNESDIVSPAFKAYEEEQPGIVNRGADVPASPAIRRMARELGVDINKVIGSGPYNRITEQDVKSYAKSIIEGKTDVSSGIADDYQLPDFSKAGSVRREKMDTIRKITARAMIGSWQNIPHVFQFDKADITDLEKFRKEYSKHVENKGGKLTVTAILLKLTAIALKTYPKFNSSVDMKNEEIIYKDYVNIGVAVDTERGLLVPVVRDADKKSITELSIELNELALKARTKKIKPDELQGANFTISNLGGIGGTHFTPIVNRPAVAILGVSRSQMEPVYIDGEFKPRLMLPLSLSYDHRVIDGAEGAKFLRWLCEAIQNPLVALF